VLFALPLVGKVPIAPPPPSHLPPFSRVEDVSFIKNAIEERVFGEGDSDSLLALVISP